jgi:hypothetical protein
MRWLTTLRNLILQGLIVRTRAITPTPPQHRYPKR